MLTGSGTRYADFQGLLQMQNNLISFKDVNILIDFL